MELSFHHDAFVPDLHWIAHLDMGSDGWSDVFYDARTDQLPCWLRLKEFVESNKYVISDITLAFRSHKEQLAPSPLGYYHTKAVSGILSMKGGGSYGTSNEDLWKFGRLVDANTVKIQWWRVPELIVINEEFKTVDECKDLIIRSM